jgi:hypothetical protein
MLLASDLVADLEALLDDENSERYSFDNDYKPALNGAVRYIMSAFDRAFDQGVLSPFIFNELLFGQKLTATPVTNEDASKFTVPDTVVWRTVGVDPAPVMDTDDYVMPGARLAKFVTIDNWGQAVDDPFAAGRGDVSDDLKLFAYTQFNYLDPGGTPTKQLVVRPKPVGDVALIYLRVPTKITLTSTTVEFPYVLYQALLMKAYQYVMVQAGREGAAALQISDKDVQELVALFI